MKNAPKEIPMDPRRKELFHKILDGVKSQHLFVLVHHLDQYIDCDKMLLFLVQHHYVGKILLQILRAKKFSYLTTAKWIIQEYNLERTVRPVIVGKDFRPS
jgi:hypothetical protein